MTPRCTRSWSTPAPACSHSLRPRPRRRHPFPRKRRRRSPAPRRTRPGATYGERLDLDHAIWVCFANARIAQEKQEHPADRRADVTVYESEDCDELVRQYLERAPRRTGPTLIPIQV